VTCRATPILGLPQVALSVTTVSCITQLPLRAPSAQGLMQAPLSAFPTLSFPQVPFRAQPKHSPHRPPDIEKGSASQPVRTPSGGLTCMGCQQKMAQACTHCRCLHVPPPQAAQCAGHMRLSALSALPADCSLSQVGAIAGPQHSQSDCMLITHQAKMMYAV